MMYTRKLSFTSFVSGTVDEFNTTAYKTGLAQILRDTGVTAGEIELVVASASVRVDALITTMTDSQADEVISILSGHAGKSDPEQLMQLGQRLRVSFQSTLALEDAIVAIATAPPSPLLSPQGSETALSAGADLDGGAIAGIIVGVLLGLGLLLFVWFCCFGRISGKGAKDEYSDIGQVNK